jgi:hypothetical protein
MIHSRQTSADCKSRALFPYNVRHGSSDILLLRISLAMRPSVLITNNILHYYTLRNR